MDKKRHSSTFTRGKRTETPVIESQFCMQWSEIILEDIIGEGSFARVHGGKWNNESVAIKQYKISKGVAAYRNLVVKEASVLLRLSHPNVVKCLAICPEEVSLVLELLCKEVQVDGERASYHNLREVIDDLQESIPLDLKIDALQQISRGIQYLHSNGIIHCDVKSANILVGGQNDGWQFKLTDFGEVHLSITTTASTAMLTKSLSVVGTTAFIPPEHLVGKVVPMKTSRDVYSFGMVMHELLYPNLKHPWQFQVPHGEISVVA
jgi:serine/threonine protein kinase